MYRAVSIQPYNNDSHLFIQQTFTKSLVMTSVTLGLKLQRWGHLAGSVIEHATLDLRVGSSNPTLAVEIAQK